MKIKLPFVLPVACLLSLLALSAAAQTSSELNTYQRYVKKGSEQIHAGDYNAAKDSFNEALRYYDGDPAGHLGLGLAYYYLREDKYAERELSRAAMLDPRAGEAYQWLGELSYRKDDLEAAVQYWEKAVQLNPSATVARARLERVRKEHRAEKDFNRDVTSHFVIKYEGKEKIEAGQGRPQDAGGSLWRGGKSPVLLSGTRDPSHPLFLAAVPGGDRRAGMERRHL